jgi:hypothetical protein
MTSKAAVINRNVSLLYNHMFKVFSSTSTVSVHVLVDDEAGSELFRGLAEDMTPSIFNSVSCL